MKRPPVEFSRPVELLRVPAAGCQQMIEATPGECAALARRLEIPAVKSLAATLRLEPWRRKGAKASGTLRAEITQICVVTLDDFNTVLEEDVARFYLPPEMAEGLGDADDTEVATNGVIDLGELAAETLALALDPYPRAPGAVFRLDPDPDSPASG